MKYIFTHFVLLFIFTKSIYGQDSLFRVIVNPDLKIDFPSNPKYRIDNSIEKYEAEYNKQSYSITSEPYPISYKGKTIKEAEAEFYPNFTARLIKDKKIKSLTEKDSEFEGHKVRELTFIELLQNGASRLVYLRAIIVNGYAEALYTISIQKDENLVSLNKTDLTFINSIDLYYKLENQLDSNDKKNNIKILKNEGFKIEK